MYKQKATIYKLSRSKAPKHGKFRLTDMRENPVDFFNDTTWMSTLAPAIIFHTRFFCKSCQTLHIRAD